MLQVGFARIDITTPLGTEIVGYYEKRVSDGVIDPLLASAVAFDNGEKKAIVMSVDVIGISQLFSAHVRGKIAEKLGMDALIELVVKIWLDCAMPESVDNEEYGVPDRHQTDYHSNFFEWLTKVKGVEEMKSEYGIDGVMNALQNTLFEECENHKVGRIFAHLTKDDEIVFDHSP